MSESVFEKIALLRTQAQNETAAGRKANALEIWRQILSLAPSDPGAANALGNDALSQQKYHEAYKFFETAVAADPGQPALLFNLAAAARGAGDLTRALAALDAAIIAEPYFVQAIFQKAIVLEHLGKLHESAQVFRDFLETAPVEVLNDTRFAGQLSHARNIIEQDGKILNTALDKLSAPPSRRVAACAAILTGKHPVYRSEPSFLTIPELPAVPFFDRKDTPWLAQIEAGWQAVRDEALSVWNNDCGGFVPYVANSPGTPLNQWEKLDHNPAWGAYFLWRHGNFFADHAACTPKTQALLDALPLLKTERRAPNAFYSCLAPHTRIPPHHGVTNARATVHLPLVVPQGCGFRVGHEVREWKEGEAWLFDDTIEHEAWNESDLPRLILIFDVWNPLLSEDEKKYINAILNTYDLHSGKIPKESDEF